METLAPLLFMTLFWASMAGAMILAGIACITLSDLTQMIIPVVRPIVLTIWTQRRWFAIGSPTLLIIGLSQWFAHPELAPEWLVMAITIVTIGLWLLAFVLIRLMFRSQEQRSHFVKVSEAHAYLRPDEPVIVLEVNDAGRAYTDRALIQPHVAGTAQVAGESITMTYCGLSNLGIAYSAEIDGEPLDLRPVNQLENNLVLWDAHSDRLVQHIWGYREGDTQQRRMREWPTRRMPFRSFAALYPDGQVFINPLPKFWQNPIIYLWDGGIQFMMNRIAEQQQKYGRQLTFPIRHRDQRLAPNERVYGLNVGDDYVAYTEEFVRASGGIINVQVGGQALVVAYDEAYATLGAFYFLEQARARGLATFDDASTAARLLIGSLLSYALIDGLLAAGPPSFPPSVPIEALIDLFMRAIAPSDEHTT